MNRTSDLVCNQQRSPVLNSMRLKYALSLSTREVLGNMWSVHLCCSYIISCFYASVIPPSDCSGWNVVCHKILEILSAALLDLAPILFILQRNPVLINCLHVILRLRSHRRLLLFGQIQPYRSINSQNFTRNLPHPDSVLHVWPQISYNNSPIIGNIRFLLLVTRLKTLACSTRIVNFDIAIAFTIRRVMYQELINSSC